MEVKKNPRNTTEWQQRSRQLKALSKKRDSPCWICGEAILYDADYRHPLSFTADHFEELVAGGPLVRGADIRPAHRGCNTRRSNTAEARVRQGRPVSLTPRNITQRSGNVTMADFTTRRPDKKAKPERWKQPGSGVLTTIDWCGEGIPLYRK